MMRAIALFGLLALSGCNAVTIGLSCENREDCSPAQDCFPVIGGFCSRGCVTEGSTADCPQGSVCSFLGGTTLACSNWCNVDTDCRPNYECWIVANTNDKKACRPEGAR